MKIDVQKFLAITTLLAAGAAQACGDSGSDDDPSTSGDGDGDGDIGGAPGDGDGDLGGANAGGAGGAPATCLDDPTVLDVTCESLFSDFGCSTYAETICYSAYGLRDAAFTALHECLSGASAVDACDELAPLHIGDVEDCLNDLTDTVAGEVCETSAAATLCADIACDELAEGQCEELFSLLPDDATVEGPAASVKDCYVTWDSTDELAPVGCAEALKDCVVPIIF